MSSIIFFSSHHYNFIIAKTLLLPGLHNVVQQEWIEKHDQQVTFYEFVLAVFSEVQGEWLLRSLLSLLRHLQGYLRLETVIQKSSVK